MSSLALDRGGAAPAQTAAADEGVIPGNPNVAHPGAPESAVAARQDTQPVDAGAASPTYNNGLYTPWTPTDQGVETVAASTPATATATQDNSVYLQPTDSNTEDNSPSSTAQAPETVTSQTVQVTPSTTSTTLIPTTPPAASTSTSSSTSSLTTSTTSSSVSSSTASRASTSSTSASGILDSATQSENSQTSGNDTKIGMILPVALSLGALALIMAGIAFVVWRRRVCRRRQLEQRRYDDAFVEKAATYDQMDGYDDDEERGMSEKSPQWQTFNRYSEVYDPPIDSGMAGAGVRNIPGGGRQDSAEAFRPRESRRPLPSTPVQQYPAVPAVMSSDYDLDAMMAQSRTGYTPYHSRPERSKSVASNIASSVYSSLSLRSKKSRSGKQVVQDQGQRRWNEHGAWTPLEDDQAAQINGSTARGVVDASYPAGGAVDRPLLSAVDGTPKKAGAYRATSPPESPTRSPEYRPRAVQHSVAPARGYILHDNPVPAYSPSAPKRQKSTATQRSEYIPDTPSVYSTTTCEPMSSASPISNYPATLQPGQSPALGKSISPVLPSQIVAQRKLQRQQSGTTYSLGGMAGLLYNEQPPQPNTQTGPYTSIPPRKPRKQSVLARYKPQGVHSPVSDEATAGEGEAPSPHRAISAVVRASKARGGSADGHSSDGHSGGQWSTGASRGLGESQASRDSIDNLLTNVLGPARSPA